MQLSKLSVLYIALSAFMTATVLVVHMSHAESTDRVWSSPLSLSTVSPVAPDTAQIFVVSARSTEIEM